MKHFTVIGNWQNEAMPSFKINWRKFYRQENINQHCCKKNVKLEEALPWWEPEHYRQANIEISISAIRFWRKIEAFPQRVVERTVESISFAISPIKPLLRSEAAEHSANAFYIRLTVETMENYSNGFPSNLLNRYSKMFRRFFVIANWCMSFA